MAQWDSRCPAVELIAGAGDGADAAEAEAGKLNAMAAPTPAVSSVAAVAICRTPMVVSPPSNSASSSLRRRETDNEDTARFRYLRW